MHDRTLSEALKELEATRDGLSESEAVRRLEVHGPNLLRSAPPVSPWTVLLRQFRNVLILLLLAGAVLSIFLGQGVEAVAIIVIVVLAVVLGFVQEFRAERAIDALREMAAPLATVWREGKERSIPSKDVVPGDVILLHTGDRIPADGRLLESQNLRTAEAALTGESEAIEKSATSESAADAPLAERANTVHAGTIVTYGRARALVVATGMSTEFGRIAEMLELVDTSPSPLQRDLDRLGHTLAKAALAVVLVIVVLGVIRGQPFVEMLIFGIALAVAAVPEALPAVVTISLALGVQRLVKRGALMRRLPAVETLGSTSVICTDKTGTLTRDEMTVRRMWCGGDEYAITGAGYEPEGRFELRAGVAEDSKGLEPILRAGQLASDASVDRDEAGNWVAKGDPTEAALVVLGMKAGLMPAAVAAAAPRIDEIPFDAATRRMTTIHRGERGKFACIKGAPEVVLAASASLWSPKGDRELTEADRETILEASQGMAEAALRVLALADRDGASREDVHAGLRFLGLVGMIDPPRDAARDAVATCRKAGIRVIMITGDHPRTASAVARELGFASHDRVLTGAELDRMDEARWGQELRDVDVFARVSPEHKLRIVTELQAQGEVVAMTGDGVNDAPALKKADIGVAMGITGTDVAKEAADMTLTNDDFASIVAAVAEGRAIFGNVKKYLMFLLSSNVGEIGLMAGAVLAGLPLPLTAVQILYVNLATDGLPALALAVDPPPDDLMAQKPRKQKGGVFSRPVVTLMLMGGLWSIIVNLGLFIWARQTGHGLESAMTMTFVSLVLIQFFKAFGFRSLTHHVFCGLFSNRWLNLAIVWEVALLVAIVVLPVLHEPFGTRALTASEWTEVILVAATVLPVLELGKWMIRRGWFGAESGL